MAARLPDRFQIGNVIVWSWVLPYFAITGAFLAKFNRYMIPILPFAMLMAAGMSWRLWPGTAARPAPPADDELASPAASLGGSPLGAASLPANSAAKMAAFPAANADALRFSLHSLRLSLLLFYASFAPLRFGSSWARRSAAALLATLGLLGGVFWSVAYVNGVYRGEHTWITASRWIYDQVPRGSVILWELWDDPLPKAIPGEPGLDMGSRGLSNIDWSPYEEDTAEKYEILKAKLREADYVAYSSKRIYDSVDELPERYPMTTRYYEAMRDGRLGFEVALEVTSPPRLFGLVFEDRTADESWSLYDHPQVTVLRKVRDLSDAEFDAVLGGSWHDAMPYYTGKESRLGAVLSWLGLAGAPDSEYAGVFGAIMRLLDANRPERPADAVQAAMLLDVPLSDLPVVDNYRWNDFASERPVVAALVWWLALTLLGWAAWPLCFILFAPLRDRGYFLSRMAGWLAAGWLLWYLASFGIAMNTVLFAWVCAGAVALVGAALAVRWRNDMAGFLRLNWPLLLAGEASVAIAYIAFLLIRMANPDLWQPWFGGEKFMEFAFLNGILRSPTFPPVDPHFAGGFINYYYFGIYLVAYLIKLTGIYAEVAFNLTIAALFALTVSNAFSVAYSAWGWRGLARTPALSWRSGFMAAWIAPLFVAVIGNLDGFAQMVRRLAESSSYQMASVLAVAPTLAGAASGLGEVLAGRRPMPSYDFWGPSRVIPNTINEFPYWSFLFADLHPHLIGIPLAILFCAALLALLSRAQRREPRGRDASWPQLAGMLVAMAFLLGALSSVNLWELPTYFGLGALALLVVQFRAPLPPEDARARGASVRPWLRTAAALLIYGAGAYLFFLPFFSHYVNVGASGVGLVRQPDAPGRWLLVWGFFGFVIVSWLIFASARRPWLCRSWSGGMDSGVGCAPTGLERTVSLVFRQFDRLPRLIYLANLLVRQPSLAYLGGLTLFLLAAGGGVVALALGHIVLGLCLWPLALAWLLLWRRGVDSDPAALLVALLATVALAILAGTQVVFLRDFLQGGDWYRMNTLFKFFSQVWVLLGLAAAIALPRMVPAITGMERPAEEDSASDSSLIGSGRRIAGLVWALSFSLLLIASLVFTALGTPARLSQRMTGWRPEFGTLNGMDYMRQGSYTWPDDSHRIELSYDWEAIQWLLSHVRGNPVIVESSEADYYRAGSSRVASFTGMSGLRGMHASEQRSGQVVSAREALHREFWETADIGRTQALIDELGVSLVYAGQLESYLHPSGVQKLKDMASIGLLDSIYENEKVTVYAVSGRLVKREDGYLVPNHSSEWAPSVGVRR